MGSSADSTALSQLQEVQGTTGGKALAPDDLLALRAFFLLLDAWDKNVVADRPESNANPLYAYIISARSGGPLL
jgi:hypothetical protein